MIDQCFKVLDDGFVILKDYMGNDDAIVQAARISYGKGTKKVSDDRNLIRYLMRHSHSTPFEMVEFKFHVRVPMDCWRQWIRHRTAQVNEYSTRYSEAIDSNQKTDPKCWRLQSNTNKQGSAGFVTNFPENYTMLQDMTAGEYLSDKECSLHQIAQNIYKQRLEFGVAREQARKDLPLSTYTEAYWKNDLHNIFHFLKLRLDSHAQFEIREYAKIIAKIIKNICPIAWEAFEDYKLNGVFYSREEQKILKTLIKDPEDIEKVCQKESSLSQREITEFTSKITNMLNDQYEH